jgi:hypothetical protein
MSVAKPKTPRSTRKPQGKLAERPQELSRAPALRLEDEKLIRRALPEDFGAPCQMNPAWLSRKSHHGIRNQTWSTADGAPTRRMRAEGAPP